MKRKVYPVRKKLSSGIRLQGMTGIGNSEATSPYGRFSIKLTTYNHRFCDISVRLPQNLLAIEPAIRKYVNERVKRGKVSVSFDWLETHSRQRLRIDEELAGSFLSSARRVKKKLGLSGDIDLNHLFFLPQLVKVEERKQNVNRLFSFIKKGLEEAVDSLIVMREKEGSSLEQALHKILPVIKKEIFLIKRRSKFAVGDFRQKLFQRIKGLRAEKGLDESRLTTEVAILATRVDITEELVRLESFLMDFYVLIEKGGLIGKRLDFILQEMLREVNTLGSKMRESAVLRSVVSIKAGLEEIRELVQNVA